VRLRPSTACLFTIATAACAVGRPDPGGLTSAPVPIDAPTLKPRAIVTAAPPRAAVLRRDAERREGVRDELRASKVKTLGRCDPDERLGGRARFTLAHLNDLQARYSDRLEGRSRYAYIAGYLEHLVEEVPATIVLDAGDDYEKGALAELRSMGESTRQMIQALPIDVRTLGNHDFAYGEAAVLRDVNQSVHPVLAANVTHPRFADDEQPLMRFARVDVGCVRVGVVGLVTQNYGADDQPNKAPFDDVFQHSARYAEVLEREVKAHRDEVDVMIALTHLGLWEDTALAMAPGSKGVDLIVGAHTEDLLRQPLPATRADGSRTWIMQAGHYGRTLGRADLVVNLIEHRVSFAKYRIVDVDASLPVSEAVAALADRLERDAAPDAQRAIASARAHIGAGRGMTELVNRAAQATLGADALLLGRDLFWSGLPKGPITLQRLYDSVLVQRQPSGTSGFSSLWLVELTGAELLAARARMQSPLYDLFMPATIDPRRTYTLALDKRALAHPRLAFGFDPKLGQAAAPTPAGELIDVLERYAHARTAAGQPLD
jgi:2',3'-cyclic-nucleotide 2'-phosphodiesterase (5'-nucleotidase family)